MPRFSDCLECRFIDKIQVCACCNDGDQFEPDEHELNFHRSWSYDDEDYEQDFFKSDQ